MRHYKAVAILVMSGVIGSFTGCASTATSSLQAGAEQIVIMKQAPKRCKFVGNVNSVGTNGMLPFSMTHETLHQWEENALKNQAFASGANTIVIDQHHVTYRRMGGGRWTSHIPPNSPRINTHGLWGKAYKCE